MCVIVRFRSQNIHIQCLVVTREAGPPAPHLPPPLRLSSLNPRENRRRPGLYSLPRTTWTWLTPVPRIPTVSRCLAALLATAPLPPKMRLALRWRRPRPGGGGEKAKWRECWGRPPGPFASLSRRLPKAATSAPPRRVPWEQPPARIRGRPRKQSPHPKPEGKCSPQRQ